MNIRTGVLLLAAVPAFAQLPPAMKTSVDEIVRTVLEATGVPSASIAIVKDGKPAYIHAYGDAKLSPKVAATPEMRYKIASNSKQILASAILLLAEDRKLSLDDTVSKYLPGLTRAREITIRQLLSHTSGYQDYYPLDYVAPFMTHDVTAQQILDTWAKKPLDFEPGTRWQYSNTNYVAAGVIVEKITGKPLIEFLRARILDKLGMQSAIDVTREKWNTADPDGHTRFAAGPPRAVAPEGNGWMWAAGELAMTASDLAKWDLSLMNGSLLKPSSLRELTTDVRTKSGVGTGYGLGLGVSVLANGHLRWRHSGGASGFVSMNTTYPDDKVSITVLTNGEGTAASTIARKLEELLLAPAADPDAKDCLERAKKLFAGLQSGHPDAGLMSDDLKFYFTPETVADFAASLGPLGEPTGFSQTSRQDRGGMVERSFSVKTGTRAFNVSTYVLPDGRFAQFLVLPMVADR